MSTSEKESSTYTYDVYNDTDYTDYNNYTDYNGSCDTSHNTIAVPAPLYLMSAVGVLGLFTILVSLCDGQNSEPLTEATHKTILILNPLGNAMVLWVLLRHIKLRTMTDVCLLNLALSDLLMAASLPLWANKSQNLASCRVITGVYQLSLYSGTLFVTFMSADRYLAIVHAVAAMRARSLRYGIIVSIIIWITSLLMGLPEVIFASVEIGETNMSLKCGPEYPIESVNFWKCLRNFSENIVALFVGLPIIVFCYVKILMVLSKAKNSKKDKAVKLIIIIVTMFVVCWVPYNVTVLLKTLQLFQILNTCLDSQTINSALAVAQLIAMCHCCINPVIYAFVGEKFRKPMISVFSKFIHKKDQRRGTSSYKDTTEKETSNTPVRSDYQ